MNSRSVKTSIRFVVLISIQVLVLNNMSLMGYVTVYPYLLFLILLRIDIGKTKLLLLGFLTGLTVDVFQNTLGMQAAAATLLVFARPAVVNFYFKTMEFSPREEPGLSKLGFVNFLKYSFTLVFIHHFFLFLLESLTFSDFFSMIIKIIINAIGTTTVILIFELLFTKRKKGV